MRIGLLGGTFNPIHIGHLYVAEQARTRLGFDQIIFIPTGDPPHKSLETLASALAAVDQTWTKSAKFEIKCYENRHLIFRIKCLRKSKEFIRQVNSKLAVVCLLAAGTFSPWIRHPLIFDKSP